MDLCQTWGVRLLLVDAHIRVMAASTLRSHRLTVAFVDPLANVCPSGPNVTE